MSVTSAINTVAAAVAVTRVKLREQVPTAIAVGANYQFTMAIYHQLRAPNELRFWQTHGGGHRSVPTPAELLSDRRMSNWDVNLRLTPFSFSV